MVSNKPHEPGFTKFAMTFHANLVCMYVEWYLLLYIDDMIVSGKDAVGIRELEGYLMCNFKMKDLGYLTYSLGVEISHTKG